MQKLQKPLRKIKEKVQAKLLFGPIRKTQRQCKTAMAGLERNPRKVQKKNQSLPTALETEAKLYLIKMLLLKNSLLFFTNIRPDLANKIPQVNKTFDQYFSPADTKIDHQDLTLKKFESAY